MNKLNIYVIKNFLILMGKCQIRVRQCKAPTTPIQTHTCIIGVRALGPPKDQVLLLVFSRTHQYPVSICVEHHEVPAWIQPTRICSPAVENLWPSTCWWDSSHQPWPLPVLAEADGTWRPTSSGGPQPTTKGVTYTEVPRIRAIDHSDIYKCQLAISYFDKIYTIYEELN